MNNSFSNLLFEITLDETWKFISVAAGFFPHSRDQKRLISNYCQDGQQATVIKFDTKKIIAHIL